MFNQKWNQCDVWFVTYTQVKCMTTIAQKSGGKKWNNIVIWLLYHMSSDIIFLESRLRWVKDEYYKNKQLLKSTTKIYS